MSRIAYVNGAYVPHRNAAVHIEDRGFQFADGVYEVLYVQDGRFIDAGLHLDRLDRSLRELRIEAPLGRAALLAVLGEVVRRSRRRHGLLYIQVTRGSARREHKFPKPGTRPSLVVTLHRAPAFPASLDGWRASAITAPDERWARCDIKTVSLLPNVLARQAASEAGALEAILYDADDGITEGSSTSVWIVDAAGTLRTRPLSHAILPGCTRAALMAELDGSIAFEERGFTRSELREAREVFLTSATSFVKPVLAIDGEAVGDGEVGPVSRQLFALMARHVLGNRAP
jgi:D-alanine transaminase